MKLTTLKVSVPVLMMMMFQSGYGVSDWFMDACRELNRGNVFEAQRLFVENNPGSVEMTQQDKDEFVVKNAELIKNAIKSFIPRGFKDAKGELDLRGIELQIDAMDDMMNLTDVTAANIQDSFQKTIVDNFWAWMSLNENKYLLHNNEVEKEIHDVTTVWAGSYVPREYTEGGETITEPGYKEFVGNDQTPGTVLKFISDVEGLSHEDPEYDDKGQGFLSSLLDHDFLGKLEPKKGDIWVLIKRLSNLTQDNVIGVLAAQAENLRDEVSNGLVKLWEETEVPALTEQGKIPADLLGAEGDNPDLGTIRKFLKDSESEPHDWTTNWGNLIENYDGLSEITIGGETATLDLIRDAATTGEADVKEMAIYGILSTRAQELRQSKTEVCWWIPDLNDFSKTTSKYVDRAEILKNALANDSVVRINSENNDNDELAFYLNLFGNWKIGGHASDGPGGASKNPEAEDIFLDKILATVGPAPRIKDVNNAIYSVFGETYEDLLRHSPNDSDLHRQTSLVQAVDEASTAEEKEKAAEISVETLDDKTAGDVVRPIEDIHDIEQIG